MTGWKPAEDMETAELIDEKPSKNTRLERPPSALVEVDLGAMSHTGNVRAHNEDHYLAVRVERSLQRVLSNLDAGAVPHSSEEVAYGMCVADGLGGMPAGGLASTLALKSLVDLVLKTPDWIMKMNRRKAVTVKRRMVQRFRLVDQALREYGDRDPRLSGMGTTLTVACSLGADLFIGHIGDSRAYLFRGGKLQQVTHDDTLAQAMIDSGVAQGDDTNVRGMRRVLTAALGSTAQPRDPEVSRLYLQHDDQLLLCTDGLYECVDSDIIASVLNTATSSDEACSSLVAESLKNGGNDNVTTVLARYRFPQS